MGGVGVVICIFLIGLGLVILLFLKKFSKEERDLGKVLLLMGCVGIIEGVILFVILDLVRVIFCIMVGLIVGNIMVFLLGCLNYVFWGGLIVLFVVDNRLGYIVLVLIGVVVVVVLMKLVKKDVKEDEEIEEDLDELIELIFEEL